MVTPEQRGTASPAAASRRGHATPLVAVTLIALAFAWVTTHQWRPEAPRLRRELPQVVSGDEPHYLLIVSSVLLDRDLFLENNYASAAGDGLDAGARFKGSRLDPHAYMVDYNSGLSIKWSVVYQYDQFLPDGQVDDHGMPYAPYRDNPHKPGAYHHLPAHPPAFSVAYARVLAALHPGPGRAESTMGMLLILVALFGLYATYGAGVAAGLSRGECVAAVGLLALCGPWLAYARSFYTEVTVSVILVAALWAHLRKMPLAAGALVVLAIWIKPTYALVAGIWFLQCAVQRRFKDAVLLAAVVACGTASLLVWNWSFARVVAVGGAGPVELGVNPGSLVSAFADPKYGLFLFAPWALLVPATLAAALRKPGNRALAFATALPLACHIALLANISFLGGWCYGPRYWIPYIPWLALLAALALRMHPALRYALAALALVGLVCSVPAALQYTSDGAIWNQPPQTALLRMLRN